MLEALRGKTGMVIYTDYKTLFVTPGGGVDRKPGK
jgi:hypothetical protein